MIKTSICKGDKVVIIKGEGANAIDEATKKPPVCTVIKVDRIKGRALVEMPRPKSKKGDRTTPLRGVEQWKTARYNQKTGEAGGLKIVKRPIHVSNLQVVEKAPKREFAK
jgi:ribosomal protein L24